MTRFDLTIHKSDSGITFVAYLPGEYSGRLEIYYNGPELISIHAFGSYAADHHALRSVCLLGNRIDAEVGTL